MSNIKKENRGKAQTVIWSHRKEKPNWLNDVRLQTLAYTGTSKRHLGRMRVANSILHINETDTLKSLKRIARHLPSGRDSFKNMAPDAACWYSDEDTYALGKMWDEWDSEMLALRAYLKEDILNQRRSLTTGDSVEDRFETPENLKRRLAFNEKWNDENKDCRENVFEYFAAQRIMKEEAARERYKDEKASAEIRAGKRVRDFIMAQRHGAPGGEKDTSTDDKIDHAVDEPALYNFSINADGTIANRQVPSLENVDNKYSAAQDAYVRKMTERQFKAAEQQHIGDGKHGKPDSGDSEK